MPYRHSGSVRYLQFDSLSIPGVIHGVFTRRGGVSPSPWAELNFGRSVGDDPARVRRNHEIALASLGRELDTVFDAWQIHSATALVARSPRRLPTPPHGDILLTAEPGVTLVMRFADCVPVFLLDPARPAVALVHAGWRGTVLQAVRVAVESIEREFGGQAERLVAGIGPSICPDHYPVGPEVVEAVRRSFGGISEGFLCRKNGAVHLDLWGATEHQLRFSGVDRIENPRICTACQPDDWYSHRGEKGRTGRFGAALALM
jgi:hypothetical protein